MAENNSTIEPNRTYGISWLLAEWTKRLVPAIEGMGCPQPVVESVDAGEAPLGGNSFWWGQQFSLVPGTSVWIGAAEDAWKGIGANALRTPGIDAPKPDEARDAYQKMIAQSVSGLAANLSERCGEEVNCPPGEAQSAPARTDHIGFVRVRIGSGIPAVLCLVVTAELLRKIESDAPAAAASSGIEEKNNPEAVPPGTAALDPILGLEMPVSVSFGRARLFLEEVLLIKEGSRIPLLQEGENLVELRMNGKAIARGELMIIKGQYGIRIVDLANRSERLEQIASLENVAP